MSYVYLGKIMKWKRFDSTDVLEIKAINRDS